MVDMLIINALIALILYGVGDVIINFFVNEYTAKSETEGYSGLSTTPSTLYSGGGGTTSQLYGGYSSSQAIFNNEDKLSEKYKYINVRFIKMLWELDVETKTARANKTNMFFIEVD